MVSKRRLDERDIKRHPPKRDPKFRILVVCEGRVTEPEYFKRYQHDTRNQRVHVKLADESGVPLTVVQTAVRLLEEARNEAKQQRDENLRYDSVWAVFDVDEHPNLSKARALALKEGIEMAISNPCFELWALLHFQDQRAHVERDSVTSMLRNHIREYEKLLPYERLTPQYQNAVTRAKALDVAAEHHDECGRNPSTTVYRLTELIRTK
jgi:hypothetical protein